MSTPWTCNNIPGYVQAPIDSSTNLESCAKCTQNDCKCWYQQGVKPASDATKYTCVPSEYNKKLNTTQRTTTFTEYNKAIKELGNVDLIGTADYPAVCAAVNNPTKVEIGRAHV